MNGRIYDPLLGRMLSADLVVQAPMSLQSYNRYSYVMNNPLTLTDPSGFFWDPDSGFWGKSEWATFAKALVSDNANTAGIADSGVSTVTAPIATVLAGQTGAVGIPGMGGIPITSPEQIATMQTIQAAGQRQAGAVIQAGRDPVTKLTGVADDNSQRRTAEVATDVATIVVGGTKVITDLAKATEGIAKASAKGEIAAEKTVATELKSGTSASGGTADAATQRTLRDPLPRDKGGQTIVPDPAAEGRPHTVVGTRTDPKQSPAPYRQGVTFDKDGKPLGRTDVSTHGRGDHTNPHFHPWTGTKFKGGSHPIPDPADMNLQ